LCDDDREEEGYIDEADRFKKNPGEFVRDYYEKAPLPSHFVLFDWYLPSLQQFFEDKRYKQVTDKVVG
jgi:hypothetical protein